MISVTTARFRKSYSALPEHIQEAAKKSFQTWKKDPAYPALRYKQVHKTKPIFSVRIGIGWRALGVKEKNTMVWFWIGSHSEYNKLVASL
jgi:hypothetical protein